ncbi:PhnB protein [Polymorphobacter multimanifer]|uniref:PhnB protein n=1 Tax=Polymorphobacter multimanifer TaxID=1070431 RepID=A0A841L8Q7_9SPHN|nr:glyoxalase/bleomycin resistance/extradiol dioxygenase family protein [Polymorphobacter multimanifer]MBB6227971.1 PhnB protein [Polymorphobacter multimanifer]
MATPSFQGVIPYLAMAGRTREACDFYIAAFAADMVEQTPHPDDTPGIMHAQVFINGGALMMTDHGGTNPDGSPGKSIETGFGHLQLVVEDGQRWWDRAVAAGCTVLEPFQHQFWGDDWGMLQDPFGLHWAVLQPGQA